MKKLLMIVATPFWIVNVETAPQLSLRPAQDVSQLQKQCAAFENSIKNDSDARSVDFSRRPPAKVLFAVGEVPVPQQGVSLHAEVSELKNLELVPAENSLSTQTLKLGLPSAGAGLESRGGETVLSVDGLDLACDLIAQKVQIKAVAPLHAGPASEMILKLNEKLGRIEKIIHHIRREPNLKAAAALLGYRTTPEELKISFQQLLDKKTLKLTDNWETFGDEPSIRFDKSKDAGFASVILSVPLDTENEIRATETKLSAFAALEFQDFTPEQQREFSQLNQHKARLVRKLILQKIQRKNYAD